MLICNKNILPKAPAPVVPLPAATRITPEKAQKLLQQEGLQLNLQQAEAVVEFLYKLAESTQR